MRKAWPARVGWMLAVVLSASLLLSCSGGKVPPTGVPVRYEARPSPSPVATARPSPRPSLTPSPTFTPRPTARPTYTPSPLPTETPPPTATPLPTEEPPPPERVFVEIVPYGQEHLLTCEAATMRMLLDSVGLVLPEEEVQACFPIVPNPEEGFRGPNIDGTMSLDDYGAHAPATARAIQVLLDRYGLPYQAVWGTFADEEEALLAVRRQLSYGRLVILWMTWQARDGVPPMKQLVVPYTITLELPDPLDGDSFPAEEPPLTITTMHTVTLVFGEHVEVVYGVEDNRVYVVDPYGFRKRDGRLKQVFPDGFYYAWAGAPPGWEYFDYAIVYIVPQDEVP
jgi:uncharacterized protein YvpB